MESKNKPIRILNIVPNMRAAGIETFIMNVYKNIDREKVQFDFLVHNKERQFFDDEIEQLGGKIYRFTFKDDKNIWKYIKDLNCFFKEHKEYKIVHGHMQSMMPLYLCIAKYNKVPIRIAHSHNGNYEKTLKGTLLHIFSRLARFFSTDNWACSEVAGKYLFGKNKFNVIYNGINVNKFEFNKEIREDMRKQMNIEDKFVITHVGRFELQKNHEFLIRVFCEVYKRNKKAILLLIGEGRLENEIKEQVKKMHLVDNVRFLGIRKDVAEILFASDCFVLPSLYEGLPVVGIEAQYAGLPCVFSNRITHEAIISNQTFLEDIREESGWCNRILNFKQKRMQICNDKFNINNISNEILNKYIEYDKK